MGSTGVTAFIHCTQVPRRSTMTERGTKWILEKLYITRRAGLHSNSRPWRSFGVTTWKS